MISLRWNPHCRHSSSFDRSNAHDASVVRCSVICCSASSFHQRDTPSSRAKCVIRPTCNNNMFICMVCVFCCFQYTIACLRISITHAEQHINFFHLQNAVHIRCIHTLHENEHCHIHCILWQRKKVVMHAQTHVDSLHAHTDAITTRLACGNGHVCWLWWWCWNVRRWRWRSSGILIVARTTWTNRIVISRLMRLACESQMDQSHALTLGSCDDEEAFLLWLSICCTFIKILITDYVKQRSTPSRTQIQMHILSGANRNDLLCWLP